MTRTERCCETFGLSRCYQGLQCAVVEEWQIAGQYEPSDIWMLRLSGHDARDGSEVLLRIDDLIEARPDRVVDLIGAYRHEHARHVRLEKRHRPFELRAAVIGQRRLASVHAGAAPACES